jgi:hypothetical protein
VAAVSMSPTRKGENGGNRTAGKHRPCYEHFTPRSPVVTSSVAFPVTFPRRPMVC